MDVKVSIKLVAIFLVIIASVMLSLVVFDAISMEQVTENMSKLLAVGGIIIVATVIIALIQKD